MDGEDGVSVQTLPRCAGCSEPVEIDPVYAAPCDHEHHPSMVWHGLCLMDWREHRDRMKAAFQRWAARHDEHD